jgi:hypothetical protein
MPRLAPTIRSLAIGSIWAHPRGEPGAQFSLTEQTGSARMGLRLDAFPAYCVFCLGSSFGFTYFTSQGPTLLSCTTVSWST